MENKEFIKHKMERLYKSLVSLRKGLLVDMSNSYLGRRKDTDDSKTLLSIDSTMVYVERRICDIEYMMEDD